MTTGTEALGYAYRRAPVDGATVLRLAAELLGLDALPPGQAWGFGGAAQWDFSAKDGRDNLRAVAPLGELGADALKGDFGHLFTRGAEVRWRRLDADSYDLLALREAPLGEDERERLGLREIGTFATAEVPAADGVLIEEGHARLGLVEYRDPATLALRLVRYAGRA